MECCWGKQKVEVMDFETVVLQVVLSVGQLGAKACLKVAYLVAE